MKTEQEMLDRLFTEMTVWFSGDPKRIQHYTKVWAYARLIGHAEGLDPETQFLLEAAAITHDIGIREAERTLGYSNGKLQEQLGPDCAERIMTPLGFAPDCIARVKWLIAHHHTYTDIRETDYRILVEADFLVNLYESGTAPTPEVRSLFVTGMGTRLLNNMFGQAEQTDRTASC